MDDEFYMRAALDLARRAYDANETPIGSVVVLNGEIIGRGVNRRNAKKNPLCHAEIEAINEAAAAVGDWRIEGADIYVTIEPCPMCAGAIIQARIKRLIYGAANKKAGCAGSVTDLFGLPFNHSVEVVKGVLESETGALMSSFFSLLRKPIPNQNPNETLIVG